MRALWASYSEQVNKQEQEWTAGLPAAVFAPWVQSLVAQLEAAGGGGGGAAAAPPPVVVTLDAEMEPLLLSKAAQARGPLPAVRLPVGGALG